MEIITKNKTNTELPDHAVVRTRRSLRPESSTNTGDFVGPAFGVGVGESVLPSGNITRPSQGTHRSAAAESAAKMHAILQSP